jgi:hypothetical protein
MNPTQIIHSSNKSSSNIILNINGRTYLKAIKPNTTISEALTNLLPDELINNRMIYATQNGKIINLMEEATDEGTIFITGKLAGCFGKNSDSDDEYNEDDDNFEEEDAIDEGISAISSAKKVEEKSKGNVHYHFIMRGQKIEKHWKIRGPHNMICQELLWGVRVDHYTVREHRSSILNLNPKTFRQEDEIDVYAQPNYAAGPFFNELILNNLIYKFSFLFLNGL